MLLFLPASTGLCIFVGTFIRTLGARNASRSLHLAFLANILHCPMNFFDVTPLGRIVNRFSKDVDTIDVVVPLNAHMFLMCFLHVISTIIVISMGTPLFLSVIVPLMILYYFVQVHLEPYNLVSSFLFLWRVHFFAYSIIQGLFTILLRHAKV